MSDSMRHVTCRIGVLDEPDTCLRTSLAVTPEFGRNLVMSTSDFEVAYLQVVLSNYPGK